MAKAAKGLGKGLQALLDEMGAPAPAGGGPGPMAVPIDLIERNPRQPRSHFDPQALQELADSIRAQGVLQPILLRPRAGGRYEIVAGERRWRAAQMAGLHEVPAVVREMDEARVFEVALIENVQREDLNPMEEAYAYYRLAEDYGHTQERIAELTGKSRSHVANFMRLTHLDPALQAMLASGALSVGHAKLMGSAPDPVGLAEEIVARGLTVRQVEELLRGKSERPRARRATAPDVDREALEQQLGEVTGLDVAIRVKSGPEGLKGELVVRFRDLEELDHVIAKLQA